MHLGLVELKLLSFRPLHPPGTNAQRHLQYSQEPHQGRAGSPQHQALPPHTPRPLYAVPPMRVVPLPAGGKRPGEDHVSCVGALSALGKQGSAAPMNMDQPWIQPWVRLPHPTTPQYSAAMVTLRSTEM